MLIKCPECGHMISDKALCCPECGYVIVTEGFVNAGKSIRTEEPRDEQPKTEQPDAQSYQYKYHYKKPKSKSKGCIMGCAVAIIIALLVFGGLFGGCFLFIRHINTDNLHYKIGQLFGGCTYNKDSVCSNKIDTVLYYDNYGDNNCDDDNHDGNYGDSSTFDNDRTELKGVIGGSQYGIKMRFNINDSGDVTGDYYYEKKGPTAILNLTGNYQSPYLTLYEYNAIGKQTGLFEGKYNGKTFIGTFTNNKKKEYAFSLRVEE